MGVDETKLDQMGEDKTGWGGGEGGGGAMACQEGHDDSWGVSDEKQ